MDAKLFQKRVLYDLVVRPLTVLPAVAGLSALILSSVVPSGGWLPFAGLCGILAGVGTVLSRWFLRSEKISERVFEELQEEATRHKETMLDELDAALEADEDPRTESSLRTLRNLYRDFKQDRDWIPRLGSKAAFDIANSVEKLFDASIISLKRSLDFWETAQQMRTSSVRESLLNSREKTLEEIEQSVRQLALSVDELRALKLKPHDQDLARIREQLSESLDVAYRVDERLQTMEHDLENYRASSAKIVE